jgi:hypothetical protein
VRREAGHVRRRARGGTLRSRIALVLALSATTVALCGLGASNASAVEQLFLNNPTSVSFTQEDLCLFVVGTIPCPSGWNKGEVLPAGKSNPGLYLPLQTTVIEEAKIHAEWVPNGGLSGAMQYLAIDGPFGEALVECYGNVPGFSCSIVDHKFAYFHQDDGAPSGLLGASPSADARFWSGTIVVKGNGVALVPVDSYSTQPQGSVRERVTLHTKRGVVVGTGEKTLQFGRKADVGVKLTRGVAKLIAHGERIDIEASVQHADGTEGTGETTTMVLTKLTPALEKVIQLPH